MTGSAKVIVEEAPQPTDEKIVPLTVFCSVSEQKARFSEELSQCHRDLLVYARSIVFDKDQARDLVQETCLLGWRKFSSYDQERADFSAWMRGLLRNKIRDWVKSKRGGSRPEVAMEDEHLDFLENHFSTPRKEPTFTRLQGCLKKLPQELRQCVRLTYYEDQKGAEASEALGIQPATLRKRLSRARQALHACLTK